MVAPAPIELGKLLHLIEGSPQLMRDVQELLERKRAAPGLAPQAASIQSFIEAELQRLESLEIEPGQAAGDATDRLNEPFVRCLSE